MSMKRQLVRATRRLYHGLFCTIYLQTRYSCIRSKKETKRRAMLLSRKSLKSIENGSRNIKILNGFLNEIFSIQNFFKTLTFLKNHLKFRLATTRQLNICFFCDDLPRIEFEIYNESVYSAINKTECESSSIRFRSVLKETDVTRRCVNLVSNVRIVQTVEDKYKHALQAVHNRVQIHHHH